MLSTQIDIVACFVNAASLPNFFLPINCTIARRFCQSSYYSQGAKLELGYRTQPLAI